jgi:hypothetical protein
LVRIGKQASQRSPFQDIMVGVAARVYGMTDAARVSFGSTFQKELPALKQWFDFVPPERSYPPDFTSARERAFIVNRMRRIEGEARAHYRRTGQINKGWVARVVDNTQASESETRALNYYEVMPESSYKLDLGQVSPEPGFERKNALMGVEIRNTTVDRLGQFYAGYVYGQPEVNVGAGKYRGNGYRLNTMGEAGYAGQLTRRGSSQLPWHAEQGWPFMPKKIAEWSKRFTDRWIGDFRAEKGKEKFKRSIPLPEVEKLLDVEF